MKIYLVGGAVRDEMLGLPVHERDYVVVGATVCDMERQGYRQVGKEFPVFLNHQGEEFALARMERKTAPGYKGFAFDTSAQVSLEDDLIRRDLTINAMAKSDNGEIVDPYHGKEDLKAKILRHVSPAFAEDPVRILRVGRFLARYYHLGFRVAPETMSLMREMVVAGEVNALVAERVWKEWERAMGEKNPEQFFQVLNDCGALAILFPGLSMQSVGMRALNAAIETDNIKLIRFAALLHDLPDAEKNIAALCNRYRVPNDYATLAKLTARYHLLAATFESLSADELLKLFSALDIYRRMDRFNDFLMAVKIIMAKSASLDKLKRYAEETKSLSAIYVKTLVERGESGANLATALQTERLKIIKQLIVN